MSFSFLYNIIMCRMYDCFLPDERVLISKDPLCDEIQIFYRLLAQDANNRDICSVLYAAFKIHFSVRGVYACVITVRAVWEKKTNGKLDAYRSGEMRFLIFFV